MTLTITLLGFLKAYSVILSFLIPLLYLARITAEKDDEMRGKALIGLLMFIPLVVYVFSTVWNFL